MPPARRQELSMPIFTIKGRSYLFIHIPKTGGSSIEDALAPHVETTFRYNGVPAGFPCPPQHLHYAELISRFDISSFDEVFAIVRHPLSRIVSEYKFKTYRKNRFIGFEVWADVALKKAEGNPFHLDNHMRPQVEFVGEGVTVFRFEEGLPKIFEDMKRRMGLDAPEIQLAWSKKGRSQDVAASPEILARIERFYAADYDRFAYPAGAAGSLRLRPEAPRASLRRLRQAAERFFMKPEKADRKKR